MAGERPQDTVAAGRSAVPSPAQWVQLYTTPATRTRLEGGE
jgi:hypothetical protein